MPRAQRTARDAIGAFSSASSLRPAGNERGQNEKGQHALSALAFLKVELGFLNGFGLFLALFYMQ